MSVELPEHLQGRVRDFPEWRSGFNRVALVLADGRSFAPVDIAWGREIVKVHGSEVVPFTTDEIVEVTDASDT